MLGWTGRNQISLFFGYIILHLVLKSPIQWCISSFYYLLDAFKWFIYSETWHWNVKLCYHKFGYHLKGILSYLIFVGCSWILKYLCTQPLLDCWVIFQRKTLDIKYTAIIKRFNLLNCWLPEFMSSWSQQGI